MEQGRHTVGPLINMDAVEKVESHLKDAAQKGAKVLTGGSRLSGTFFEPTVIADVPSDALVSNEETFGPVAPLIRFKTEEEVISMANDTEFGLAGYFFSPTTSPASGAWPKPWKPAWSGSTRVWSPTEVAPFGGIKQSGLGHEGSKYGIEDYLEVKYVCLGGI